MPVNANLMNQGDLNGLQLNLSGTQFGTELVLDLKKRILQGRIAGILVNASIMAFPTAILMNGNYAIYPCNGAAPFFIIKAKSFMGGFGPKEIGISFNGQPLIGFPTLVFSDPGAGSRLKSLVDQTPLGPYQMLTVQNC